LSKDINNSKIDTSILKNYGDKLSKLFQPDTIDDNNFLFARGLLTEVNYFQSKSQNRWQFFSNNNALRNKQEGWRQLFSRIDQLSKVKNLLDKITEDNLNNDLNKIIN